MSGNVIRISYVRATFAAGLLAGCRSSLLNMTDLLDNERGMAASARRRSTDAGPPPESADRSKFVAAALYAEWIADALHRQIAFYFELDNRLAGTFDTAQLPPTGTAPQAPPEWPQPPLPEPLDLAAHLLTAPTGASELPPPRARIAVRMQEIAEDLDEAIRAINWSQRVRFQAQISQAAANLCEWVALSAPAASGDD